MSPPQSLKSLLEKLLEPNPLFRLGSGREGAAEIRRHPWFAGLDWAAFERRQVPAPYLPKQPTAGGEAVNFARMDIDDKVFRANGYVSRGHFRDF